MRTIVEVHKGTCWGVPFELEIVKIYERSYFWRIRSMGDLQWYIDGETHWIHSYEALKEAEKYMEVMDYHLWVGSEDEEKTRAYHKGAISVGKDDFIKEIIALRKVLTGTRLEG